MPKIISEMVKPAEKINSINTHHPFGGGFASNANNTGGDKPAVNQVVDSIMEMAVQLPVLQKIGESAGLDFERSLNNMSKDKDNPGKT